MRSSKLALAAAILALATSSAVVSANAASAAVKVGQQDIHLTH